MVFVVHLILCDMWLYDLVLYVAKTPLPKNGDHVVFDFIRYVRGKINTISCSGWFSILYVVGTVKDEA